ncbi:MAG TPA: DUF1036 domain-containing protein [Azospirillaceae bacterium]|nr:DUF1036 domain-containing protein [Azospirillaceae bacterium]
MRRRAVLWTALVAFCLPVLLPGTAEARLTVCNRTAEPVRVALGMQDGDGWASRGWWRIEPGQCGRLIEAPLDLLEYYLRAEPVKPGTGWGGDYPFCIVDADFQDRGDESCERRAKRTAGFFMVPTDGATAVTHNLTD